MLFLALTAVGATGAKYDAKEARLEAPGAAAADLRAPSAAIARVKAERAARTQAEKRLAAALEELGCKKDAKEVVAGAAVEDERFGSDGSVALKLTLSTKGLDIKR